MTRPTDGPLAGVRVIELGGIGPGPYGAMLLADMGADLVRVDTVASAGRPSYEPVMHRNRRSVTVDLKDPRGVALVLDMIASSDVVIEGFRPGVTERLGLGPATCLERNPRLVYGRMTGYGQDGPMAQRAGHDINYASLSGVLGQMHGPVVPLNLIADMGGGGVFLALGIVSALLHAERTGTGQVVDAAMVDGSASLMAAVLSLYNNRRFSDMKPELNGIAGSAPWYHVYECSDGRHIAVGCMEPQFWATMLSVLGRTDDPILAEQNKRAAWPAMIAHLEQVFIEHPQSHWAQLFDGTDACVTPVQSLTEALADSHIGGRGTYYRDENDHLQPGVAPRFSVSDIGTPQAAPTFGEHTRSVLLDLGVADDAEVERLLTDGVIATAEAAVPAHA